MAPYKSMRADPDPARIPFQTLAALRIILHDDFRYHPKVPSVMLFSPNMPNTNN
jgi:hypothetical protein